MNATRYVDCIIFCQKGIFDGSQNSQRLIGGTGTTFRGRKVITRKAAINTEFDKRNSPVQNLLESICTVRGYELGRVKSIRQGHSTEIYARKTRLGRNGRINELKRPISSSLTSLITIKQIDDTRFRMMGKKSNVLTSKRGA